MSTTSSFASYKFHLPNRQRSHAPVVSPYSLPWTSTASMNQGLFLFNTNPGGRARRAIKMDLNAASNIPPGAPIPSGSSFPGWSLWILVTAIPIVLPLLNGKWGPLIAIKQRLATALKNVETVAEVVEEAAERIDKVADEITEKLPEGSKLKEAIHMVDSVAEGVIKGADFAEDLIKKVEEVEKKVDDFIEKEEMDKVKVEPKSPSS